MELTPCELVPSDRTPDTIAGWKAMAQSLLSAECCAFHRNLEISCRYAWIHQHQPTGFKWAAMAAIASHHVRLALFPLRLDTDRAGYLDLSRSLGRRRVLLTQDVNTIRGTNNAIFDVVDKDGIGPAVCFDAFCNRLDLRASVRGAFLSYGLRVAALK